MKLQLLTSKRAARIAAFVAVPLLVGGSAYAVTDTAFQYSAPKHGYVTVAAMAMAPRDDGPASPAYGISWTNGLAVEGDRCFNSGLNFPQGATLVDVTVWYQSGNTSNPNFIVYRHRLSDGDTDSIVDVAISDNSNTRKPKTVAVDPSAALVQNPKYDYGFGICLGDSDKFYAARIHYTYTNAGD